MVILYLSILIIFFIDDDNTIVTVEKFEELNKKYKYYLGIRTNHSPEPYKYPMSIIPYLKVSQIPDWCNGW